MTSELWLLCCMAVVILLTAGLAFLWAVFYDRCAKEKRMLERPDFTEKAGFAVTRLPGAPYLRLDRSIFWGGAWGSWSSLSSPTGRRCCG